MKLKSKSLIITLVLASFAAAEAMVINPTIGVLNTSRWEGNPGPGPGQSAIDAYLNGLFPGVTSTELYKATPGSSDAGSLSGSYSTIFNGDESGGTITYGSGNIVSSTAYMLVKDGNHNPMWYFYNLSALGWNGTDSLVLSGFWPQQGSISHVTLYGTSKTPPTSTTPGVPDGGTTLALLGGSLVGLGSLRRLMARKA